MELGPLNCPHAIHRLGTVGIEFPDGLGPLNCPHAIHRLGKVGIQFPDGAGFRQNLSTKG